MGLFNRKEIKALNEKVAGLMDELDKERQQAEDLKAERDQLYQILTKDTSDKLECTYCFSSISGKDRYCPNCGMLVEKSSIPAAEPKQENLFSYEKDKDGVLIVGFQGKNVTRIIIPSVLGDKPVIGVWHEVFKGNQEIEEVIFKEGCQYLGNAVFSGCSSLRTVRLPKSLKEIGNEAFLGCERLQNVIIPENVSVLGSSVFYGCTMLKKLILPNKLEYIPEQMLCDSGIEEIQLPDRVRIIGKKAFMGTSIRSIELPTQLEYIFLGAFAMCQDLETVVIHSNVKRIDPYAFDRGKSMTIYGAEGSVAQDMKTYMKNAAFEYIKETSEPLDGVIGYQRAAIVLGDANQSKVHRIEALIQKFDIYKAATWSWVDSNKNINIDINRYISADEAEELKAIFGESLVLHSFRD